MKRSLTIGLFWMLTIVTMAHPAPAQKLKVTTDLTADELQAMADKIYSDMDTYLLSVESQKNVITWTQAFVNIIRKYPFMDFYVIERRLRYLNSQAYLIAAPAFNTPKGFLIRSPLGIFEGEMPYYLYVSGDGPEKAELERRRLSAGTYEENLEHLKKAGVLVFDKEKKRSE